MEKENRKDSVGKAAHKVEDLTNQLKRALADYSNLEKRILTEREFHQKNANLSLILKFLPILDSLEKASLEINNQGLSLIVKQFKEALFSEGVKEINSEYFDPEKQEALEIISGEDDGKVVEVISKGYEMGGRVILPAKVKVIKKEND